MSSSSETSESNEQQIYFYEYPTLLKNKDPEALYIIVDTLNFGTTLSYLFDTPVNSVSVFPDEASLTGFMEGNNTHLPLMNIKPTNTEFLPNSASKIPPSDVRGYDIAATSDNGVEVLYEDVGIDKFVIFASSTNASAVVKEAYATERDIYIVCASTPSEPRREDVYIGKYIEYGIKSRQQSTSRRKYERLQRLQYIKFKYFTKWLLFRNKLVPSQYTSSDIKYIQQINAHHSVPARVEDNLFVDLTNR